MICFFLTLYALSSLERVHPQMVFSQCLSLLTLTFSEVTYVSCPIFRFFTHPLHLYFWLVFIWFPFASFRISPSPFLHSISGLLSSTASSTEFDSIISIPNVILSSRTGFLTIAFISRSTISSRFTPIPLSGFFSWFPL